MSTASAVFSLAVAAIFGFLWQRAHFLAHGLVALSFLLRVPVSYKHPIIWRKFLFGSMSESALYPRKFELFDSVLSIFGFLLLVAAGVLYVVDLYRTTVSGF